MNDVFVALLRPLVSDQDLLTSYEKGDWHGVLNAGLCQRIFQEDDNVSQSAQGWLSAFRTKVEAALKGSSDPGRAHLSYADAALVASACLNSFLQSNVTGPPLPWSPVSVCLPARYRDPVSYKELHYYLTGDLSLDGEAVYRHIPHVELFWTAKCLSELSASITDSVISRWVRFRTRSWHQRLLNEVAHSLQKSIRDDMDYLSASIVSEASSFDAETKVSYLLERASAHLTNGEDRQAREGLQEAALVNGFRYVLTGRLGKRTKYQTFDTSQLVVLARSAGTSLHGKNVEPSSKDTTAVQPENIDLNDDTLLEKISFTAKNDIQTPEIQEEVPPELQDVDAGDQPILKPLDSIILLTLASSITNTSPDHGLAREETLPYASRVLEGGSSNWQIYSQALLVRSRIEGYKARTVERGVLQMQALVDQVIAETTPNGVVDGREPANGEPAATTFLPRPKPSEAASPLERLQYIHSLASPTRWSIEAELADRWVSVGGLRTALEIYERLKMWAEAALCCAALEDEPKARALITEQLYTDIDNKIEKELLPNDAPRLFCILGDIDNEIAMYERSWEVSKQRYARAQRSLGKHYLKNRNLEKADEAYSLSLKVNPQNSQAWFSLGCIRLELKNWKTAVEAFSRVVQREQDDAEAWSNLAAALLRLPPEEETPMQTADDEELPPLLPKDPQKHAKQAFAAFKKAANLKRESYRIWQNVLNVAATLTPPPYNDIVAAQTRIIELRGSTEGEACLDIEVLEGLLNHIIEISRENGLAHTNEAGEKDGSRRRFGLERMFLELMNKKVIPLITHSRRLWILVGKFNIYLNKPSAALDAYEKAWRVAQNKPGWDNESGPTTGTGETDGSSGDHDGSSKDADSVWRDVVDSTIELVDAYESLGDREVTEGLKAGSGELVCRNWKQKARMAIRSVTGRRSTAGLGDMEELQERLEMLKSS